MKSMLLSEAVECCERWLAPERIRDYDGARNGLQVANRGRIHRIAAAVDASLTTVRLAAAAGADLMIVHHGLFWSPRMPWTGPNYELLRALLDHDIAVYSSHLPLDAHPRLGNSARLADALGWRRPRRPFFFDQRNPAMALGVQTTTRIDRAALVEQVGRAVNGPVRVIPGGPAVCRRIGIVTGGAGGEVALAAREGVDTFITGEGPHWTYALAEELGLNVLYAGHYATETFGVRALAEKLAGKAGVPWVYLDHPTGL